MLDTKCLLRSDLKKVHKPCKNKYVEFWVEQLAGDSILSAVSQTQTLLTHTLLQETGDLHKSFITDRADAVLPIL